MRSRVVMVLVERSIDLDGSESVSRLLADELLTPTFACMPNSFRLTLRCKGIAPSHIRRRVSRRIAPHLDCHGAGISHDLPDRCHVHGRGAWLVGTYMDRNGRGFGEQSPCRRIRKRIGSCLRDDDRRLDQAGALALRPDRQGIAPTPNDVQFGAVDVPMEDRGKTMSQHAW